MGYVYELTSQGRRLLCCDVCGHAGGVRRMPCKYGWCQPTAMCADCRANHEVRTQQAAYCEEHCRQAAAEYAEREERKVALLESGAFVPATPSDFGISLLVDYERRETVEV